jgi:hypothetical protein
MSNGGQTAPDAAVLMRKVRRALMEAEEDVLPFAGKRLTLNCITRLCTLASSLKKDLQVTHLELDGDEEYQQQLSEQATACRKKLTAFLVDAEESREKLEAEERLRFDQAGGAAGVAAAAAKAVQQPLVARKVTATIEEMIAVRNRYREVMASDPCNDAELYEKMEKLRILDEQAAVVNHDSNELGKLVLEVNLPDEGAKLDDVAAATRKVKAAAADKMLQWRRDAGIWSEKKKRGSMRTDLKMPTFSAGLHMKLTIYDFEKEWKEYCDAMEYSKEEAVKMLKVAVQPPARGDVVNFQTEQEIFCYLKKHHGNPMVLLNAREKEIRSWALCRGSDMAQRDWLIQAKSKLETTLKMCQEHDIERYLHFSGVATEIQNKFPPELTKDFKLILKKHLSPRGVLEKEKIIGLLLDFIDDKILDCTLGVNLDIVNDAVRHQLFIAG